LRCKSGVAGDSYNQDRLPGDVPSDRRLGRTGRHLDIYLSDARCRAASPDAEDAEDATDAENAENAEDASTDIRELRETLAELRRDMERGLPPAPEPKPAPEPAPRDRSPMRPPPVDARALLKIEPPPKFSGTDRRMPFRDWWMQVEEFLEGQPEEVVGGERRRILWVSRQLEKEAQEWYLDWKQRVERGQAEYRWASFVDELRASTLHGRERSRCRLSRTGVLHLSEGYLHLSHPMGCSLQAGRSLRGGLPKDVVRGDRSNVAE
jgi:hypothetical protein